MKRGGMKTGGRRGIALFALLGTALATTAGVLAMGSSEKASAPLISLRQGRLDLARAAFLGHDAAKAERLLRDILQDRPEDREARLLLGRVLSDRGRHLEARELYEALLKANAKDVDALRGLGQVLRGLGQHEAAVRRLQAAVDLRKDDPSLWKELGLAQREGGDALGALFSIQKSLSLDRDQADLSALLSELAMGKPADAGLAPGRARPGSFDPLNPRPVDPASFMPVQRVPDPSRHFPTPNRGGGR